MQCGVLCQGYENDPKKMCFNRYDARTKIVLLTSPVNVHPGTNRCTPMSFLSFKSQLRCSAKVFTADLLALYAGLPGGFVIPCLLPVMTMADGEALEGRDWKDGTYVLSPLTTPKRFVESI